MRARHRLALLTLCLPFAAHAADSAACAQCHREIYESYRRTPMAAQRAHRRRPHPRNVR
ncbi:exported hypothetical protein [Candidatus Sulfopaludibacter sp. SbA3]|nr:exported hypothetical protein [Candidatus Sulfopaludibacter sp. SbA3]